MSFQNPRFKRKSKLPSSEPILHIGSTSDQFKGVFNGFSVEIRDEKQMKQLITRGNFGKANLSRNYPQFSDNTRIIRNRLYLNRKSWGLKWKQKVKKVVVVPDSDSEGEYFKNLKPEYQMDYSGLSEIVALTLEEAFFLLSVLNCLQITHNTAVLDVENAWKLFFESDKYFLCNYISYYYFRSKNWVVKPGLKFGGDFLLYKDGPAYYHASYLVIIQVVNENFEEIENLNKHSFKYLDLMGLNRLCETAGKELIICQVICPPSVSGTKETSYKDITKYLVRTVLMKRWIGSKQKDTTDDV